MSLNDNTTFFPMMSDLSDDPGPSPTHPPTTADTPHLQPPEITSPNPKRRTLQHVLINRQRYVLAIFMKENAGEYGEKGVCARTIKKFSDCFRGKANTNFTRAMRYWRSHASIINLYKENGKKGNGHLYIKPTLQGIKLIRSKAAPGHARKKTAWSVALHADLLHEFETLRKAGVRFNRHLLKMLALRLIQRSQSEFYGTTTIDPRKGDLIFSHKSTRWIQQFMQENNIICRAQTGKLAVLAGKQELVEREVAYFLGKVSPEFRSGELDEDCGFNADETHFVIDLHYHKTIAMRGDENVKYADVISGDVGMTMMVTIAGGVRSCLLPAFMIFQNPNRSYPIQGVPDNVPGVSYRSGPKGWMDRQVFVEWLKEFRVLGPLSNGKKRVLFMDNCSGDALTDEAKLALQRINSVIRFLLKTSTDLCQTADSFIIQKLKAAWKAKWDLKRIDMTEKNLWGSAMNGSGKLMNPGKPFFLKLVADVVRELSVKRDKEGVLYTRKAMIRCGLAKNLNGIWEGKQLFPHLQAIISKYRDNFNGLEVESSGDLDGKRTEMDDE